MKAQWWIIAQREMTEKLRDKGFIFSTVLLFVLVAAASVLPGVISEVATTTTSRSPRRRSRWWSPDPARTRTPGSS